jgi:GT2 family glycosyltransferase/glycosyltransferase involved in cell wall biosynthesis
MSDIPTVTVIVLNYNGRKHLEGCFPSLLRLDYPTERLELMLVDNASNDGSVEFTETHYPQVRIVRSPTNLGFAAGNNLGARQTDSQYVIFLNNDMHVDSRFVQGLIDAIQSDPDAVCAGAKILNWDGSRFDFAGAAPHFAGFAYQLGYDKPFSNSVFNEVRPILFACGGAMIIDRQLFLEVGGFDEDYFIYFEDVDLGWRLWVLGHKVVFAPGAVAYHHHHGTMRSFSDHRKRVLYKRNALFSVIKNYDEVNLGRVLPAILLGTVDGLVETAVRRRRLPIDEFRITNPKRRRCPDVRLEKEEVSTLVAIHEVAEKLPQLMERRRFVQGQRKRSDEDVLRLFLAPMSKWPDVSARTQRVVTDVFGVQRLFEDAPRRILLFSSDILPFPGLPTVGSGLRCWGLSQGLKNRGHEVILSMPRAALKGREHLVAPEVADLTWEWHNMHEIANRVEPDVVVVCNWPLLDLLDAEKVEVPIILDQHGPHLIERELQGFGKMEGNVRCKLNALRKADYFTCAGNRQYKYFQSWLEHAGWTEQERRDRSAAIPVSMPPELPERRPREELTFVYGGVFLPWQDPSVGLSTLVEEMERRNQGHLRFFGGPHLVYPIDPGIFGDLVAQLRKSPRVTVSNLITHDELLEEYRQAHVAMDLMKRNPERELAFTTRTVEYLWCGLPVIYNDYSELSDYIREYDAGWTVDPEDHEAIRSVIAEVYDCPDRVVERGRNAQQLVREQMNWDLTIEAMDGFVRWSDKRPSADRSKEQWLRHLWDRATVHYQKGGARAIIEATAPYLRWRLDRLANRR